MTTCLPLSWMQGKFFSCNDLSKMTEEECKCVCVGGALGRGQAALPLGELGDLNP